jgi:hypothetical protein
MSFIDLLLNLAGLLLWLKWRDKGQELSAPKISLLGTLKKIGPRYPRALFLVALVALLTIRAFLYWQLGPALNWIPRIWFGIIPLSFRSDYFGLSFLFSFLSFGAALIVFYTCLLLLSILSNQKSEVDPVQHLVRKQLGKLDLLPAILKFLLPWVALLVFWCLLSKPLVALKILPSPKSLIHLVEQGAVVGVGVYLTWKYLIVGILLLHLLNSYVYFGAWPFWPFIDNSARQILKLLSWIPLRIGKIDFAPLAAMAFVILATEFGGRGLIWIYQRLPG